ncbi:MAG: hypothetical protein IT232_04935 [Flavobacteriales bacterium]|nr:hypothetical protein [Flavobacteriales bacterium]
MKLFNKYIAICSLATVLIGANIQAHAQCTSFTKKNGLPALAPFTHNGQLTSAKFMPGETADIEMSFNAKNEYRVLVLWQEILGNVTFKIKDKKGNILFSSNPGETMPFWDFRVNKTQELIVQVDVPKQEDKKATKMVPEGCISILVGFRAQEGNESNVKKMK